MAVAAAALSVLAVPAEAQSRGNHGGNWHGGNWHGGNWHGGNWHGGNWHGANRVNFFFGGFGYPYFGYPYWACSLLLWLSLRLPGRAHITPMIRAGYMKERS